MIPLGIKEVREIVSRLKTIASKDTERMINGWIRQRIVLKRLFALFQNDDLNIRSQSDSMRKATLDEIKKSVHMEDKKIEEHKSEKG